jgi:serine/threonine protein phosphatase PrpC
VKVKNLSTFSHPGSRRSQEDHVLCDAQKRIFVVADGFGGPIPGSNAAKTACEAVKSFLFKEAGDLEATLPFVLRSYYSLAGNVLFNALIHANRRVTLGNRGKSVHERGGASVLAGMMDGDLLAIASVGSCSAWLIRGGEARQLVTPRSYGTLVDPFASSISAAQGIPLAAVGMSEDLEPEIIEFRVREGDWVFLNTDGISKSVRDELAKQQSSVDSNLEEYLQSQMYRDNATLALLRF